MQLLWVLVKYTRFKSSNALGCSVRIGKPVQGTLHCALILTSMRCLNEPIGGWIMRGCRVPRQAPFFLHRPSCFPRPLHQLPLPLLLLPLLPPSSPRIRYVQYYIFELLITEFSSNYIIIIYSLRVAFEL